MTDRVATTEPASRVTGEQVAALRTDNRLFCIAAVGFACWVLALVVLALATANPVQVNLAQLSRATLIVTVRVVDVKTGACELQRSFSPGQLPQQFTVTNLTNTVARTGEAYLLPLARDVAGPEGSYRVVEVPELELPPLIYPASPKIESQVEAWQRPPR